MEIKLCDISNNLTKKLTVFAALPLFLFGLLIAGITIFLLIIGGPSHILNIGRASIWHNTALVMSLISVSVLVYAAVAAIMNRLAVWSYTWLGVVLTGYIVSLNLVLDGRNIMLSKITDMTIITLSLLSCLVIFGFIALKGWRHTALTSIGFCGSLGLSLCFFGVAGPFQTYLGLLAVLLGLIEAVLVCIFIRYSDTVRFFSIIVFSIINIGLAWIIEAMFRSAHPGRDMGQFWYLATLLTSLLFGGTLCGLPGQFLRKKFKQINKMSGIAPEK